jgi:hypothetical protein
MAHLTKALIKKYGISKEAWRHARAGSRVHHSSGKPSMSKKKRFRRLRRLKRRVSKAKVPFETVIAAGLIPFTPADSGWGSTPFSCLQTGDITGLTNHLKSGFLGMTGNNFDIAAALNPFNMNSARYSKMILYASLLGMVRRKITGRYTAPLFKKIPLIGRIVS